MAAALERASNVRRRFSGHALCRQCCRLGEDSYRLGKTFFGHRPEFTIGFSKRFVESFQAKRMRDCLNNEGRDRLPA
jgi:hypothetical protein